MPLRSVALPSPRHRIVLAAVTVAIGCGAAPVAQADERPLTLPTRDVDVSYEVGRPGQPGTPKLTQRMRWAAATRQLRVDPPSPGLYVVMDYRTHLLSAVRPAQRLVLQVRSDGAGLSLAGAPVPKGGFERLGVGTVAGLACTDWQTRDTAGEAASVCLTADGVLLRARIGRAALVEATRVAYGPIAPELFDVPDGYRHVAPGQHP